MTEAASRSSQVPAVHGRDVPEGRHNHPSRGTRRPIARIERRVSTVRHAKRGAAHLVGGSTEDAVVGKGYAVNAG